MEPVAGTKRPFAMAALGWHDRASLQPAPSIRAHSDPYHHLRSHANQRSRSNTNSPVSVAESRRSPIKSPILTDGPSIFLTGMPGSGKSTLAIVANANTQRKLVALEREFHKTTGQSTNQYRDTHGRDELQRRQTEILRDVTVKYAKGHVVDCSSSFNSDVLASVFSNPGGDYVVIYVVRDAKAIVEHLSHEEEDKIRRMIEWTSTSSRRYRAFEFFNVSEQTTDPYPLRKGVSRCGHSAAEAAHKQKRPAFLKRAERHFLKFLSLIMPKDSVPFIEDVFPLASLPAEKRQFTYATSVPLSVLLEKDLDIQKLETGADAIEIVVDDLVSNFSHVTTTGLLNMSRASEISRIVSQVRRSTVISIIYHVQLPEMALRDNLWRERYLEYVRHGLRLAAEYVTIDLRLFDGEILNLSAIRGNSKLIGNLQLNKGDIQPWKNQFWTLHYQKAQSCRCDMVRFTQEAVDFTDNEEVRRIPFAVESLDGPPLPLIAYNTGLVGRTSACFNKVLTSVAFEDVGGRDKVTELNAGALYPRPSITALQATLALKTCFCFDQMKLYVFGANVDYSLSPAMHNKALEALGLPYHYSPVSAGRISSLSELVHDAHFAGASVGLPFKVEIIALTKGLSAHAAAIGAVNTLIPVRKLNEDGSIPKDALSFSSRNRAGAVLALYGDNTDWIGIRACIKRGLSPANAVQNSSSALVIGAGGMARASVYAMLQLGVKNIAILNRSVEHALKLVADFEGLLSGNPDILVGVSHHTPRFHVFQTRYDPWPSDLMPKAPTMIVSCIPTHSIGDSPAPDFTLPTQWLESETGGVVVELAYKTLDTPLLVQMREKADKLWVVMDGLDLLPEQGFAQFELFTGRRAPRTLMRREVFNSYQDEEGRKNLPQLQPRLANITEQEP